MALTREKILKHTGMARTKEVHVPAWVDETGDDVVIVRGMTLMEFEILGRLASADDGSARILARTIVDDTGGSVFKDADADQINQLPLEQAQLLMEAVNDLSGLGSTPAKQAAADAEIEGESAAQSSSSE